MTVGFDAKCRGIDVGSAWDEIYTAGCSPGIAGAEQLYRVLPWEEENRTLESP